MAKRKNRVAIVTDGEGWYVRRIRVIEHDLDKDERVYLGTKCPTVEEAVALAKQYLGIPIT